MLRFQRLYVCKLTHIPSMIHFNYFRDKGMNQSPSIVLCLPQGPEVPITRAEESRPREIKQKNLTLKLNGLIVLNIRYFTASMHLHLKARVPAERCREYKTTECKQDCEYF